MTSARRSSDGSREMVRVLPVVELPRWGSRGGGRVTAMCVVTALLIVLTLAFAVFVVRVALQDWREVIERQVREEMNNG